MGFLRGPRDYVCDGCRRRPKYQAAVNEPDDPSMCVVISHGSAQSVNHMNASHLRAALAKGGCKPKQPVRLEACSTGKGNNSIAEQLARLRGTSVTAPDDRVWTAPWDAPLCTPYRPERKLPGGIRTRRKTAPLHGARNIRARHFPCPLAIARAAFWPKLQQRGESPGDILHSTALHRMRRSAP